MHCLVLWLLTHRGNEPEWYIYESVNWVISGSDNGLLPVSHQAFISTNDELLSTGLLRTKIVKFIKLQLFSFKIIDLKMSAKYRPFCSGPGMAILTELQLTPAWQFCELHLNDKPLKVTRWYAGVTVYLPIKDVYVPSSIHMFGMGLSGQLSAGMICLRWW